MSDPLAALLCAAPVVGLVGDAAPQHRFTLALLSKLSFTKHIAQHGGVRAVPGISFPKGSVELPFEFGRIS